MLQTVDLNARLPEDMVVDRHSLRVLVVGPDGLQTIYSPAPEPQPALATPSSTAAPAPASTAPPPSVAPAEAGAGSVFPQRRINTAIKLPGQVTQAPAAPHAPKEQVSRGPPPLCEA